MKILLSQLLILSLVVRGQPPRIHLYDEDDITQPARHPGVQIELVSDDVTSVIATQEQKSLLHPNAKSKLIVTDELKNEKAADSSTSSSASSSTSSIASSASPASSSTSQAPTSSTLSPSLSSSTVSATSEQSTSGSSASSSASTSSIASSIASSSSPTSSSVTPSISTSSIASSTSQAKTSSTSSPPTSATSTVSATSEQSTVDGDDVDHALPGWALALILLAVTGVLLGGVFLVFLKYRRSRIPLAKPVQGLFRKSTVDRSPRPIRATNFHKEYQNRLSSYLITEEFERVQEYSARINATKSRNIGQQEKNRNRNRFVDIIPFDDNYVQLDNEEGSPSSNYVNASYIHNVPGVGQMIATQGPKQNTVVEFWRMVIEAGSKHIINLTNNMEGGRVKCFQYWPPNGQMLHFDDISLFTQEEKEVHPGLYQRKIEVQLGDEAEADVHIVNQLHLTTWPDHSVPGNINSLIAFLNVCERFGDSGYTVIHCSAGVGRTGTLMALRSLMHCAREGLPLDVMKTVFTLRGLRPKLVQTYEQYALLYQVLDAYLERDMNDDVAPPADDVLDAGIDNFGFEHVKL